MNDPLNTGAILRRALDPAPRSRPRRADQLALAEVRAEEADQPTLNSRYSPERPHRDQWQLSTEPHYSKALPEPLDDEELKALAESLEVWVLPRKGPSFLKGAHRVAPKKLFGLSYSEFPTEEQREYAASETLRIAQMSAHHALEEGARRVVIRSHRRKAASSRFCPGLVISNLVGVLSSTDDILIHGLPTEASLAIDAEFVDRPRKA